MIQAAARSGLDFAKAEPRNRFWWIKTKWMLDRIEDENTLALYSMQHAQHAAVLDYKLEKQAFDDHWTKANALMQNAFALNFPWAKDMDKKHAQNSIDQMMDEWKKRYGDPKDPAVQAKFLKMAERWRKAGQAAKASMFSEQRKLSKTLKKVVQQRKQATRKGK